MKKLNALLATVALMLGAQTVQAKTWSNEKIQAPSNIEAPLWDCALSFNVEGGGLKLIVGKFQLEGQGQISCMDIRGNTQDIPVYVTLGGAPVSLGFGIGKIQMVGMASGIGIAGQPEDLLGEYIVAGMRGSLLVGGGADVALHATHRSFALNTSIQLVSGLGVNAGVDYLTIERL